MQIRQWKQLHHSKGHGIYEVPRRVWYGMKGRNLWVAGTRISGQIIEGDEVLAHRAALDGIVNTRVWIPDLASVRRTPPVGIEGARLIVWVELITAEFSKVSCALQGDRKSTRLNSSHGYISYAVFCLKKKRHTTSYHTRKTAV